MNPDGSLANVAHLMLNLPCTSHYGLGDGIGVLIRACPAGDVGCFCLIRKSAKTGTVKSPKAKVGAHFSAGAWD